MGRAGLAALDFLGYPVRMEKKPSPALDSLAAAALPDQPGMGLDSVVNHKTGVGTRRDKSTGAWFLPEPLTVAQARDVYLGSDIARKVVDLPAEEMTRAGFNVRVSDDSKTGEAITSALSDLGVELTMRQAVLKRRAFGGALVMINVTDGNTDPSQPVNEARLESIDSLTVFEPGEAAAYSYVGNPAAKGYGTPEYWSINPRLVSTSSLAAMNFLRVHPSRCIVLSGPILSRFDTNSNQGFGSSVLDHLWRIIARFDQNYASAGALIDDFAQAIFKIKGLYNSMVQNGGADVKKRLELMDMYRSMLRGVALDADHEDFERKPTPIAGLSDLLEAFTLRMAGASNIPHTVLMGKSPSGLAASGDNDTRMWYDEIAKLQKLELQPGLIYLTRLLMLSKRGPTKGVLADDWSIQFSPLWQPSENDKANTRKTMADADAVYLANGVVDSSEVRESRFGGDEYSIETQIDNDSGEANDSDLEASEGVTTIGPDGTPIMVKPGAVGGLVVGAPGAGVSLQDTALNGMQVTSMIEIVTSVLKGQISRESGRAILTRAFHVRPEEAEAILGPTDFEPDLVEEAKLEAAKNPAPVAQVKPPVKPIL